MSVDGANMLVMFARMMLGDVVTQVFAARAPCDGDGLVSDLIGDPKIPHFHGTGALAFDSVVGNSGGGAVIADDGCGRLGVTHFL